MVKEQLVLEMLSALREYVNKLKPLQKFSLDEIASDYISYWAVLHGLQLAIQCTIDIGSHLLSGIGAERPADYKNVILGLGRQGIISADFAKRFQGIAGFRNILVHQYLQVNVEIVYEKLEEGLEDFEQFMVFVHTYLQKFKDGEVLHRKAAEHAKKTRP
jgi:uncharacterized protein YutE (UPF0331/DUF86 family)